MNVISMRFARYTGRFDAVASFYREVLGFGVVDAWDREPGARGIILAPSGDLLGFTLELLEQRDCGQLSDGCSFGVEVEDVDAIHGQLVARGVAVDKPPRDLPWGHRTMNVSDPDGFSLWIFQDIN